MDPKQIRERLGLPEDASDEQVQESLRALNEAAGLKPEVQVPAPAAQEPPAPVVTPAEEPKVVEPVAAAGNGFQVPPGTVLVEASMLEEIRANGAAAREVVAERTKERREGLVAAAVADGRIAPARQEHWLKALEADEEGAKATLAALAPGLVPVEERGHGHAPDTLNNAQLETEVVASWTQQLFPETREHYSRLAAAAAGEGIGNRRRIQSDAHYTR